MLRKFRTLFIDLFLIVIASVLALVLRDNLEISLDRLRGLLPYILITLHVAVPVILLFGLERVVWRLSSMGDYQRVVMAALTIVLFSLAVDFVYERLAGISRSFPILQFMLMSGTMVGARLLVRQWHMVRRSSRASAVLDMPLVRDERETVLVVGFNRVAELYLQSVAEFGAERIVIAGLLGRSVQHTGRLVHLQKVLGIPEEVAAVLRELDVRGVRVDRIVVAVARRNLSKVANEELERIAAASDIEVDWIADKLNLSGGSSLSADDHDRDGTVGPPDVDDGRLFRLGSAELEKLRHRPYWRVKRALDVVGSVVLMSLALPLAPFLIVVVAFDVGWPVVFWQQRPGLGGQPFKLFKLRTMGAAFDEEGRRRTDAERVSAIGRFLRRTRLDELPQLFHVLVGHMSFVGPRPLLPADQPSAYVARLAVRPGLTGWAQVMGGRDINARDKAALDVWYVCNASLRLDIEIVLRTIPMVFRGERIDREAIGRAWSDLRNAGISRDTAFEGVSRDGAAASRHGGVVRKVA